MEAHMKVLVHNNLCNLLFHSNSSHSGNKYSKSEEPYLCKVIYEIIYIKHSRKGNCILTGAKAEGVNIRLKYCFLMLICQDQNPRAIVFSCFGVTTLVNNYTENERAFNQHYFRIMLNDNLRYAINGNSPSSLTVYYRVQTLNIADKSKTIGT